MFRKIIKKLRLRQILQQNAKKKSQDNSSSKQTKLSHQLQDNLTLFRNILGQNSDLVIREFSFGGDGKTKAALIFFDGLVDKEIINESIIKPLMYDSHLFSPQQLKRQQSFDFLEKKMISVGEVKRISSVDDLLNDCLYGDTVFLIDNFAEALIINTKGWEFRGVTEPKTEAVVRGPREGFTETLNVSISLLRRKIRHPDLIMEKMQLGEKTKTEVCLAYLKGVVSSGLVAEVKTRLQSIKTDAILESGYIEQFIEDAPFSPFPTVANSEKPDVVAAKLLEGRVAILVDGTPMVLTVPMLFVEGFQTAEDYYSRPYYVSFIRFLRFISFFISLLAPGAYVALTTFHQELIPTPLLLTIAAAREGAPFPVVVEILLMGLFFEIIREAGIRLPRPIGSAISIVGALVIGEAAVSAGLIGAPIVIVIAITAITSFVVISLADVVLLLRLLLILAAAFLGGFGIIIFLLGLLIHLTTLRSFGAPYFAPFAPLNLRGLKDTVIRAPLWAMGTRPQAISTVNRRRQKFGLLPQPPSKQGNGD
jgi:spore germination protein KA